MSESFGARARNFFGWAPADDDLDVDDRFDEYEEPAPLAEVAPLDRVAPSRIQRPETRAEAEPAADLSRIVTVHPEGYSDAMLIGEAFRAGTPVIINLTELAEPEARRLVDFAAGLTFGLHGAFERVTNRVFLLSPSTVEVCGSTKNGHRGPLYTLG
ncbi:cell division protein SepF [Actinomyces sp. B33]|uniref:cell division protein SepF n=1 Tax=Actinomyces sp. B33 TaxID=2942131 RepID=UPI0023403B89|nr:cell division protein SepF [Actinomyces sp. B33]MDC4233087.1 cell division protein SepF [Actinomyces sp. B33]